LTVAKQRTNLQWAAQDSNFRRINYLENTSLSTQDDAESDASSTVLDALVKSWGMLTADDRRRIIAIVNGRLA